MNTQGEYVADDWVASLGNEFKRVSLEHQRRLDQGFFGRIGRRQAIVAFAVLAMLPAAAFSANALWNDDPPHPAPGSGVEAEFNEPLSSSGTTRPGQDSSGGGSGLSCAGQFAGRVGDPPAVLVRDVSVLKRRRPSNQRIPDFEIPGRDVYLDYSRVVRAVDGEQFVVAPVASFDSSTLPDTKACATYRDQPSIPAMICVAAIGLTGGSTCAQPARLRDEGAIVVGDKLPGRRRGTAHVFGVVADDVKAVRLEFHPESGVPDITVPVRNNVFSHVYNGDAGARVHTKLVR